MGANELTKQILNFLFLEGVFAWRNSVGAASGTYVTKDGEVKQRFMRMGLPGSSDIIGIMPGGKFLAVEVKVGRDRLRPEQEGFLENVRRLGGTALVVKTYEEFLELWKSRV